MWSSWSSRFSWEHVLYWSVLICIVYSNEWIMQALAHTYFSTCVMWLPFRNSNHSLVAETPSNSLACVFDIVQETNVKIRGLNEKFVTCGKSNLLLDTYSDVFNTYRIIQPNTQAESKLCQNLSSNLSSKADMSFVQSKDNGKWEQVAAGMILSLTVPLAFWPLRVNQCIKSCWIIWCTICDPYSPSKKNGQIRRILSCTMLECICTKTFAKLLSRRITVPTWRQPSNWTILGRTPNSCCTLSRFGWSSACHCWRQSCPANPCIAGLRGAQALFGGFWTNLLLYLSLLTRQVRHPSK